MMVIWIAWSISDPIPFVYWRSNSTFTSVRDDAVIVRAVSHAWSFEIAFLGNHRSDLRDKLSR